MVVGLIRFAAFFPVALLLVSGGLLLSLAKIAWEIARVPSRCIRLCSTLADGCGCILYHGRIPFWGEAACVWEESSRKSFWGCWREDDASRSLHIRLGHLDLLLSPTTPGLVGMAVES
jgi:hypothetical protein